MSRHFGFDYESTWSTPVAPTKFMEAISESIQIERNFEEIQTIRTESTRDVVELNSRWQGDVEVIANYQDVAYFAHMLLGDTDTTGVGPYTHTSPGSTGIATRPSMTLELRRDTDALTWRYDGGVLTGLAFNFALDAAARITASFFGDGAATGTAATASFPDFDVMLPKHVDVLFDATSSTSTTPATAVRLNIGYPVDEPYILGQTTLGVQPQSNGVLSVACEIDVLFADMTQYNKFDGSTDLDIGISIDSGGDETCTINLNNTRLTQATPHLDGRNRLVSTYTAISYFDTTATENIQIVTVNDLADPTT